MIYLKFKHSPVATKVYQIVHNSKKCIVATLQPDTYLGGLIRKNKNTVYYSNAYLSFYNYNFKKDYRKQVFNIVIYRIKY